MIISQKPSLYYFSQSLPLCQWDRMQKYNKNVQCKQSGIGRIIFINIDAFNKFSLKCKPRMTQPVILPLPFHSFVPSFLLCSFLHAPIPTTFVFSIFPSNLPLIIFTTIFENWNIRIQNRKRKFKGFSRRNRSKTNISYICL